MADRKIIYVTDDDRPFWDEMISMAERRGSSMSATVNNLVRQHVRDSGRNAALGLPPGFKVPASMKDPVTEKRDILLGLIDATVREKVDEIIEDARKEVAS